MINFPLGFLFGLFFAAFALAVSEMEWKSEVVQRGYALYCPTDGRFAWKGECDD